ncbi:DNA polymerase III subunit chi [Erythrobacter sp.]|jgi:DNA polymerase-3 subunit chi|uniref:DNA polymerase III subunit chi n=1 Tax=Erythrobacter sp. TaxID=1042 RepID=UPI002EC2DD0D|nr:DNA polymerase III subunit chi [Erythrobacter sp.]
MKVDFWQLSRDRAEQVVALIAGRVIAAGERLLVVSEDEQQRAQIAAQLWDAGPESFLANGMADAPGAERQPILIGAGMGDANGASHVILADGIWRQPTGFERAFLLFGEPTLDAARAAWRGLDGESDVERAFFRQDEGKWVKVG